MVLAKIREKEDVPRFLISFLLSLLNSINEIKMEQKSHLIKACNNIITTDLSLCITFHGFAQVSGHTRRKCLV